MPLKIAKSGVLMFQIRSGVVVFLNSVFHFCFKMKLKLVCSYIYICTRFYARAAFTANRN